MWAVGQKMKGIYEKMQYILQIDEKKLDFFLNHVSFHSIIKFPPLARGLASFSDEIPFSKWQPQVW